MAHLKTARTTSKRAVTKEINLIKQCIAEDDTDGIDDEIVKLKELFRKFKLAHDAYHEKFTQDEDIDESEAYFYDEQKEYISSLNSFKVYCKSTQVKTEITADDSDLSRNELLRLLNLPRVELENFSGNPLHFHQFIRAFDVNVDKICQDSDLKLSRLMQYTSGPAKEAIRGCQLIGGETGYYQARSILFSRFGNPHLVTERLVRDLKSGRPVRSPQDIQQIMKK